MGGALVLQTLARSPLARHVSHVVLDAPVVSWVDVVAHHARLGRLPSAIVRLAPYVLSSRHAVPLVGIADPLHLSETEWRDRAGELTTPILLIHSVDDEFVPVGPSIDLADTRPDLVRFVPWRLARHTKEWNTDPDRWDALVREFLDPGPTDS